MACDWATAAEIKVFPYFAWDGRCELLLPFILLQKFLSFALFLSFCFLLVFLS